MTDRSIAGRATYARNFGVDEAEAERILTERVGPDFTREVFEAAGGLGWQGTSLTDRNRSNAIIAVLVCQNINDARLVNYLTLARNNGVDERGLAELMVLLTAYVGQPTRRWRWRPYAVRHPKARPGLSGHGGSTDIIRSKDATDSK